MVMTQDGLNGSETTQEQFGESEDMWPCEDMATANQKAVPEGSCSPIALLKAIGPDAVFVGMATNSTRSALKAPLLPPLRHQGRGTTTTKAKNGQHQQAV